MKLRIARHTNQIDQLKNFYMEVVGLKLIGQFNDHDGYDGVILSGNEANWQIEFTTSNQVINHQPNEDDLIVLYVSQEEFNKRIEILNSKGIESVKAKNPYWNKNAITIVDPDGFGLVFSLI